MNNQGNKAAQKEHKNFLENKLTDMETCAINNREFKITVLKKLSKISKNTGSLMNSGTKVVYWKN